MKTLVITVIALLGLILVLVPVISADHAGREGAVVLGNEGNFCDGYAHCSVCSDSHNSPDARETIAACNSLGASIYQTGCTIFSSNAREVFQQPGRFGTPQGNLRTVTRSGYAWKCSDELRITGPPEIVQNAGGRVIITWGSSIYADGQLTVRQGEERAIYRHRNEIKTHEFEANGLESGPFEVEMQSCSNSTGRCAVATRQLYYGNEPLRMWFTAPTPGDGAVVSNSFTVTAQSSVDLRSATLVFHDETGEEIPYSMSLVDARTFQASEIMPPAGTYSYKVTGTGNEGQETETPERTLAIVERAVISFTSPTPGDGSSLFNPLEIVIQSTQPLVRALLLLQSEGGNYRLPMIQIDPFHFSITVRAQPGLNSYQAEGVNRHGMRAESEMRSVNIRAGSMGVPELTFITPPTPRSGATITESPVIEIESNENLASAVLVFSQRDGTETRTAMEMVTPRHWRSIPLTLEPGIYSFHAEAVDQAGENGISETREITMRARELPSPVLEFIAPTPLDGASLQSTDRVRVAVSSNTPLGRAVLTLSSDEVYRQLEMAEVTSVEFALDAGSLPAGTYSLSVEGEDRITRIIGISETRIFSVVVDSPPVITFQEPPTPANGANLFEGFTVEITANEPLRSATLTLTADGSGETTHPLVQVTPTRFRVALTPTPGSYSYRVAGIDNGRVSGQSESRAVRIRNSLNWLLGYSSCRNVRITAPSQTDLVNYPLEVTASGLTGKRNDNADVRIVNAPCNFGGAEIPRDVISSTPTSADVLFSVTATRGSTVTYSVYYNNPSAVAPSYMSNIEVSASGVSSDFDLSNQYIRLAATPGAGDGLRVNFFGYDDTGSRRFINILNLGFGRGYGWYGIRNPGYHYTDNLGGAKCVITFDGVVKKSLQCWVEEGRVTNFTFDISVYNGFKFTNILARGYWITTVNMETPDLRPMNFLWNAWGRGMNGYYEDGEVISPMITPSFEYRLQEGTGIPRRFAITFTNSVIQSYIFTRMERQRDKFENFEVSYGTSSENLAGPVFKCKSAATRLMEVDDGCIQEVWLTGAADPGNWAWQFWTPPVYAVSEPV